MGGRAKTGTLTSHNEHVGQVSKHPEVSCHRALRQSRTTHSKRRTDCAAHFAGQLPLCPGLSRR
eukprot:1309375-Rhodomonas_salina.1